MTYPCCRGLNKKKWPADEIGRPNLLSPQEMPFGVAPQRSPLSHPCTAKLAINNAVEL